MGRLSRGWLARAASLALLLAGWQAAADAARSRLMPAPLAVLRFVAEEAERGDLLHNVGVTLARVAVSFGIAMALGVALGAALGRARGADLALDTPLLVLLNTPALVIAVLAYVWVGLTETAAILAVVLNKLPTVAVIVREGARNLDPGLDEMARAYGLDRRDRVLDLLWPQLQPSIVVAARSGLSLAWKIVLVVELLGRPDGVGFAINYYFVQSTDVAAILGYSLVFMGVMIGADVLVLQRVEAHVRRWR